MNKIRVNVEGLTKTYPNGSKTRTILDNCTFQIESRKLTAITGASGSGKTMLLKILGGLLQPDSGSVQIAGREISGLSEAERSDYRALQAGFVFQDYELLDEYTVGENIRLIGGLLGKRIDEGWYRQLLKTLDLDALEDAFVGTLSGGEKQRTAIARALCLKPAVVFADEPTGNLDAENAWNVFRLLKKCCTIHGQTILLVTHDLGLAKQADRLLILENGKVRAYEA